MADHVEIWDIERLIPSARNARTHSGAQVAEIAGSIAAFGFIVPVLVDRGGNIIAGHGRVLAARQLQLDKVPVIVVEHLTDAEKRAYALADNKITLNSGWDDELLRVELEALKNDGFELENLGFSEREFSKLLHSLRPEPMPEQDSIPKPSPVTVTRSGDLWHLGKHRLLCGDATQAASYAAVLSGELAHMVFTDPRYSASNDAQDLGVNITIDDMGKDVGFLLENACNQMLHNTRGALYICVSSSKLPTLYDAFTKAGGHWSAFLVWGKHSFTFGGPDYQRQFEPILYGWREGTEDYWCGARDQGDLWLIDGRSTKALHKPVDLVERAVRNSSRRGELVLDPFAGSGTTLIACEKTGRQARVIEIEPGYCDVAVCRWQDFSGKEAVLDSGGATFRETRARQLPSDIGSSIETV